MKGELQELGPTINSPNNDHVKYLRSLQRRRVRYKERRFIVEGLRLVEDALRAGVVPALVFFAREVGASPRGAALLRELRSTIADIFPVGPNIMKMVTDTASLQGVVAVVPFVELLPQGKDLFLVVDRVQDPGNLGTLLRSAEAAGVQQALLAPGTVDAFSPKVVRAGAGVHFRLPIKAAGWPEIRALVKGKSVRLAEEGSPTAYYEVDWKRPAALIVCNEGSGPSDEARVLATERIAVPMHGDPESLNVGVAASVILFEAARQRALAGRAG